MDNTIYLENTDITNEKIISDLDLFKQKTIVVFIQSEACVVCSDLKNKYNTLENKDNIIYTTIQADGEFSSYISPVIFFLLDIKTVPYFLIYNDEGNLIIGHKSYTRELQSSLTNNTAEEFHNKIVNIIKS